MGEHRAREEFAALVLVEPCALDVEEAKPGEPGKREGIDGELCERTVGTGVVLVIQDMDRFCGSKILLRTTACVQFA